MLIKLYAMEEEAMDRRFIYDDNKRIKGYIQNDVIYNDMGKIVGYKSGDYITDAPRNGKMLYGISNDGYITEGTSRKIVAQVHENGYITKGTSNRIAGSVDRSSTAAIGVGIPNISGAGLLAVLIGCFLIYFGIIEVPKVIADQFKDIDNFGRITN